jgi:hypothetical protein
MTREEAEQLVWADWGDIAQEDMGCELRIEPTLTEEYEWGWVIYLAAVRPEECRHQYPYDRYACERREGKSIPVGTKGLEDALVCLGLAEWEGLSETEFKAMWSRLLKRCR